MLQSLLTYTFRTVKKGPLPLLGTAEQKQKYQRDFLHRERERQRQRGEKRVSFHL